MNIRSIIAGFWYWLVPHRPVEAMASRRAHVCRRCPHLVAAPIRFGDDRNPWMAGKQCELCGCFAPQKIRSKSEKCDMGKW